MITAVMTAKINEELARAVPPAIMNCHKVRDFSLCALLTHLNTESLDAVEMNQLRSYKIHDLGKNLTHILIGIAKIHALNIDRPHVHAIVAVSSQCAESVMQVRIC